MKFAELTDAVRLPVQRENTIRLPLGLLGFEHLKDYVLLGNPEEAPFWWLQVLRDPDLAFVVVSPFCVVPDYQPEITEEDALFLQLTSPQDALVFTIVKVHSPTRATLNLKGPILLNRRTLVGKQVIPKNAAEYSVDHPLPTAA